MRATPVPAAARSPWATGAWRLLVLGVLLCGLSGCNVITFNRQLTLRSYARLQIRPQERELSSGHLRYYAGGQGFPVLLIHGFGFSFALRDTLQFAGNHLLTSLFSFNVGVELGQLLVVALLAPVRRTPYCLSSYDTSTTKSGAALSSVVHIHRSAQKVDCGTLLKRFTLSLEQSHRKPYTLGNSVPVQS